MIKIIIIIILVLLLTYVLYNVKLKHFISNENTIENFQTPSTTSLITNLNLDFLSKSDYNSKVITKIVNRKW